MIEKVEWAKSSKSRCRRCNELILRYEPRGVGYVSGFYCFKCTPDVLKAQMVLSQDVKRQFRCMVKKSKKLMILNRLENGN